MTGLAVGIAARIYRRARHIQQNSTEGLNRTQLRSVEQTLKYGATKKAIRLKYYAVGCVPFQQLSDAATLLLLQL